MATLKQFKSARAKRAKSMCIWATITETETGIVLDQVAFPGVPNIKLLSLIDAAMIQGRTVTLSCHAVD